MMYNIRSDAIGWQKSDLPSDGNSNVCSISHHLQNIRKSEKYQNFDVENKGQGH